MAKKNIKTQKTNKTSINKKNSNQIFIIAIIVLIIAFAAFLIINNLLTSKQNDTEFIFKKDGVLTFSDSTGNIKAKIDVQIANTDFDRQLGLMFRKSMSENQGYAFYISSGISTIILDAKYLYFFRYDLCKHK